MVIIITYQRTVSLSNFLFHRLCVRMNDDVLHVNSSSKISASKIDVVLINDFRANYWYTNQCSFRFKFVVENRSL